VLSSVQDPDIRFLLKTKAVGWKATDWNLDRPDWKGKLRLVSDSPKGILIKFNTDFR
jgi:hypothetical protein